MLAAAGHTVAAVARTEADLRVLAALHPDRIIPLAADARDPAAFADEEPDHAIVYGPAVTPESLIALQRRVRGASVEIATSAAADPGAAPLALLRAPWHRLLLGWTPGPEPRWHTPEEISAAALDALREEVDCVLGVVRPWRERPTR